MKQKRAPFPDPSARKAKGQPRGKKIANAPTLPHTSEVVFALFVAYLLCATIIASKSNSLLKIWDDSCVFDEASFYPFNPLSVLLEESRDKTGGLSEWRIFFLSQTKRHSVCHACPAIACHPAVAGQAALAWAGRFFQEDRERFFIYKSLS